MKRILIMLLTILTACSPMCSGASAADIPHENTTIETVKPAGINVKTGSSGVYVYTNDTDSEKKFSTDDYNFRYSNLLVFNKDGKACGVGNNLVRSTDGDKGEWLREMTVPAGGFAVALTSTGTENPFGKLYQLALDGGIIYNSITGVLIDLYAEFDGETLTAYVPEKTETDESAKNILLVGNSSTYFAAMPSRLRALARNFGQNVRIDSCTEGSAYLAYFADETKTAGIALRKALSNEKYDLIVLQDASGAGYNDTLASVNKLKPLIEANGADFVFYTNTSSDVSRANARIKDYDKLCDDFGVKASPTCLAFASFIAEHPEINLFYIDNSHNSAEGAYLVACTLYMTLFGDSPAGNKAYGELSEANARLIENFVADSVRAYESTRDEYVHESQPEESSGISDAETSATVSDSEVSNGTPKKNDVTLPLIIGACLLAAAAIGFTVFRAKKKKN